MEAQPNESEDLERYVLRMLDECRDEVKIADAKTNMLFGAVAAVVFFMLNILLNDESMLRSSGDGVMALSILSLVVFFLAFVMLGLAVTPRLVPPEIGKARYFREVAQFDDPQALLGVLTVDAGTSVIRHTQQMHVLARIVQRKYRYLSNAMQAIAAATTVLVVAVLAGVAH